MAERDPGEYVPCPRHGTRCYPEIPDLAQRVECAIGLGDRGPAGVKATAERIMMMIEDESTPDPLNLPAYAWGESVTWNNGRILVPLNSGGESVADLELDEGSADLLADMLKDAAAPERAAGEPS